MTKKISCEQCHERFEPSFPEQKVCLTCANEGAPLPIALPDGLEIQGIPTADLRTELARGLTLTADTLYRLGLIWQELERRGEDLSDLRHGLARTLPLIAAGLLAAEAVVAFAGRPAVLRALEGVPLEKQRGLAAGEMLSVIDPTNPQRVQQMSLSALPAVGVRLVFADGEIRTPEAQRLALRPRQKHRREDEGYRYRPRYDKEAGTVTVGKMVVRLDDLLHELAASAGPDRPTGLDQPEDFVQVKVRLSREESQRLLAASGRAGLPEWEVVRKALRAFGLI